MGHLPPSASELSMESSGVDDSDAIGEGARTSTTRLFVYGSLMRGEENASFLAGARFLRAARTEPRYALVDLGVYAALVEGGVQSVAGELYEVDAALRGELDVLEEHPRLYERRPIRLSDGSGAHAYLMDASRARGAPEVASGDWRGRGER